MREYKMNESELEYIKSKLEMIRDHLFNENIEIALYNVGYLSCYIDSLIEDIDALTENEDDENG